MAKSKASVPVSETPAGSGEKAKKVCPVTRAQFKAGAKPIIAQVNGQSVLMDVKEFSSGTFGWFANGNIIITIGDVPVKVSFQ